MNENYSTKTMHYDVLGVPEGKTLFDYYPELKYHEELRKGIVFTEKDTIQEVVIIDAEKAFTFCSLLVDPKSPFNDIRDFKIKAERCALYAGFPKTEKGYSKEVQDVMDLKNYQIQIIMLRYFMNTAEYEFEQWISLKMAYHQATMLLRRSTSKDIDDAITEVEKKLKIQEKLEVLKGKILEMEAGIFDDERIKEALQKAASSKNYRWAEEFSDPNPDEQDLKHMEDEGEDDFENDWK